MWHDPTRFRRVCPLLVSTPEGWRCSVDAVDVRPFWGLAVRHFALGLLISYIVITAGLYGVLRYVGYHITPLATMWPPAWHQIHTAQEGVYAIRAARALNAGNLQSAVLALELVCDINPHNVPAGLALANLWQVSNQPALADGMYLRLIDRNPEARAIITQAWYHALLSRADYPMIKELSVRMLSVHDGNEGVWLHALFFASRQTKDVRLLKGLLAQPPAMPVWCLDLVRVEVALLEDRFRDVRLALTSPAVQPPSSYVAYYQIERLIMTGHYYEALAMLDAYGKRLNSDEATFHRLRIFSARGWSSLAESEFDRVLSRPLSPRVYTLICAYLIRQPNRALLSRYFVHFMRAQLPLTPENYPYFAATYTAAAANGNWERATEIEAMLKRLTGAEASTFQALLDFFRWRDAKKRIELILPVLALPTEVSYSLLERYQPIGK